MSLTEKQKSLLRWIVKQVRAGMLNEEEIWFYWSHDGTSIVNYQEKDVPEVKTTTLDILYHFSKVMTEMVMPGASQFCRNIQMTFWAHAVRPYHWRNNIIVGANCIRPL